MTNLLMGIAEPGSTMHMATGYFNIPDVYTQTIFHKSAANFKLLFSHPMANSFQQAKGAAGFIPTAYSFLTNSFYNQIQTLQLNKRITCYEYQRTGWTFHSKGLWYTPKNYGLPVLTAVGSSNYGSYFNFVDFIKFIWYLKIIIMLIGARSLNCDLESQLIIITNNTKLQKNFDVEKCGIYKSISLYNPDSNPIKTPLWVRLVLRIFKNYF